MPKLPMRLADLRTAMGDPRYSQTGHPEQAEYRAWVGEGFQRLTAAPAEAATVVVEVRPYRRTRAAGGRMWTATGRRAVGAGRRRSRRSRAGAQAMRRFLPNQPPRRCHTAARSW